MFYVLGWFYGVFWDGCWNLASNKAGIFSVRIKLNKNSVVGRLNLASLLYSSQPFWSKSCSALELEGFGRDRKLASCRQSVSCNLRHFQGGSGSCGFVSVGAAQETEKAKKKRREPKSTPVAMSMHWTGRS